MEDIRIYDFDFQLLHIEHNISSCYWNVFYNDIGTFEGTFPLDSPITKVLFSHKYLFLTQGNLQAIITGKTADKVLHVYGKTPNWILSRRTIAPFKTSTFADENYDKVVEYVLKTAFSDIFDTHFTYADETEGITDNKHFWRITRNPASEVIRDRIAPLGIGHRVTLDLENKRWAFALYGGNEVHRIISEENRTMNQVALCEDLQNFYTAGYYYKELSHAGEWSPHTALPQNNPAEYGSYYTIVYEDGETQKRSYPAGSYLVCDDEETGAWHVHSDLPQLSAYLPGEDTGIYRWDASLSCGSLSEAEATLAKRKRVRRITGDTVNLAFGKDVNLGDFVTVQVEKGGYRETLSRRVVGAELWYESGNSGEKLIFEEDENGI